MYVGAFLTVFLTDTLTVFLAFYLAPILTFLLAFSASQPGSLSEVRDGEAKSHHRQGAHRSRRQRALLCVYIQCI